MTTARLFSVAAVAALASFAAQADTYGANFQSEFQSNRTRAEVHGFGVNFSGTYFRDSQKALIDLAAARGPAVSATATARFSSTTAERVSRDSSP